jgi:PAS domain S-box-containing protein
MHEVIEHLRRQRFALTLAGAALLGTLLMLWVVPISRQFPFALFIAAVMVSAWSGGVRPGLVTTGASAFSLLILYLLLPAMRAAESGEHFALRLIMFLFIGLLAGYLSMKCKEAILAHDRFHDAVAGMGEALIFTDAQGKITFLNKTAQSLTGLAPADVQGKRFGDSIALLEEDSRRVLEDPAEWVLQTNAPAALPDGTLLRSVTNSETPIEGTSIPLYDANERVVGVAVAFHSAVARRAKEQDLREREQRFRTALGSAPAALLMLDVQGRCVFTNRVCQALGDFSFDEGLGHGWTRCIHIDDRDRVLNEWSAAMQGTGATFQSDFRLKIENKEARRVRLQAITIISDHAQSLGQIVVIEDVTDLIQSTAACRASEERAQRAEAARQTLEEQGAAAAQRQKKIEEALGQLREELAHQLQVAGEEKRSADQRLALAEKGKQEAERARDDAARRLEESETARRQAEETLHGSQLEFARLMDEHIAAERRAEETLQQTRDDFARQLADSRRELEDALRQDRNYIDPAELERHAAARREAEDALQAAKKKHVQEIDQLSNDSLAELGSLEDKLRQAHQNAEYVRKENEELRRALQSLQQQSEGTEQLLAESRRKIETLTHENELLAEALRPPAASTVPAPLEPGGYVEPAAHHEFIDRTPAEAADWLSFN